jgi:hypothetical protein
MFTSLTAFPAARILFLVLLSQTARYCVSCIVSCICIVLDEMFVRPQANHSRAVSLSVATTTHVNVPAYNAFLILLFNSQTSYTAFDLQIHIWAVTFPFSSKIFHHTFSKTVSILFHYVYVEISLNWVAGFIVSYYLYYLTYVGLFVSHTIVISVDLYMYIGSRWLYFNIDFRTKLV